MKEVDAEESHRTRTVHDCAKRDACLNLLDDVKDDILQSRDKGTIENFEGERNPRAINPHDN